MTIQNEGSFPRVIYRGEEDLESEQATAAALIEAIQNYDCHKVLHDYRAVTGARMGTLHSYSAAASYDRRFSSSTVWVTTPSSRMKSRNVPGCSQAMC